MRPLEIALLLLNVVPLARPFASSRVPPAWMHLLPGLAALAAVAHAIIEGARWQMVPAYVLTAGLLALEAWKFPRPAPLSIAAGLAGVSLLSAAFLLSMLVPVFRFPEPSGPHPIGTVTRHLTDVGRRESAGPDTSARRELMVQVWYPAREADGKRARYRPEPALSFQTAHLALVKTHAVEGAPLAGTLQKYPVLIFSPAWNGRRVQNTFQFEALASHGYVVVGIDHPYGSANTVFPDGRVVRGLYDSFLDYSSDEGLQETTRRAEDQLQVRARDAIFVLDELRLLDERDPAELFSGRLDLNRVGIFGHSFGGAVAAEACRMDSRFRAGLNMDGLLFGEAANYGVTQPFLIMHDDTPIPTEADLATPNPVRQRYLRSMKGDFEHASRSLGRQGGYLMSIRGARHLNFCDSPLFCRIRSFTGAGPISVDRAMAIINDYSLAFFDRHLKGADVALLDAPSRDYPEVTFERFLRPRRALTTTDTTDK